METYDDIELNEDETHEALRKGREEKHFRLKREAYNEKLRKNQEYLSFKSEDLLELFGIKYKIDGDNQVIVNNLCHYFANDERFYGDLNKGLLLVGGVGIGKSTLMDFFKRNQRHSYRLLSCREIESDFSSEGEKSVQYCSYNIQIATNADPFGHQEIGFCFDDLGTEANGKHFGKEKNVMAEIILNRYDNKIPYHCTHITTNLTADQIREQYGSRVTDRMREMFNIITFSKDAKSRRK